MARRGMSSVRSCTGLRCDEKSVYEKRAAFHVRAVFLCRDEETMLIGLVHCAVPSLGGDGEEEMVATDIVMCAIAASNVLRC